MGRPPLPLGTWGDIRTEKTPKGWRARARFRDFDGVTRDVERTARTAAAAKDALRTALSERSNPPSEAGLIDTDTRIKDLVHEWYQHGVDTDAWATNTRNRYREVIDAYVNPGIGLLMIREASVPRMDSFLKQITARVGAPTAKLCRTVLSGAFGLAVRQGATRINPIAQVERIKVSKSVPTALDVSQVRSLRAAARVYEFAPPNRNARPRHPGVLAIIDTLLGTGARIGEVLALRWSDFDFTAGTVTISGTVIRDGTKLFRQEATKTHASYRVLSLPRFTIASLLDLQVRQTYASKNNWAFPSEAGTLRDPSNFRKVWRSIVKAAGLEGITPHGVRRTVATAIDRDADAQTAAHQLGHASTAITGRHYIERAAQGPDVRDLLDGLAG